MASEQERPLAPPKPEDKDLMDYTTIIQGNFEKLFEDSHIHLPLLAAPGINDGRVGDIRILLVGTTYYLYAKVSAGLWKKVALS